MTLAPLLLGKLVRKGACTGIIVETEAYGTDAASHAATQVNRGRLMRDTTGHWYVYFTYGMHWCANITCDESGAGAVLIRAVEPLEGIELMQKRRKVEKLHNLCNGPAKFCQAFGISGNDNGTVIGADFALYDAPALLPEGIATSPRIGIKHAADLPWRFYIRDNTFVGGTATVARRGTHRK